MRKIKLFSLFVALICATGLWATPEVPKTWTYEKCKVTMEEDGTLYVDARFSSNVEMDATRDGNNNYAWHLNGYGPLVQKVVVSEKITSISDYAFHDLGNLTEVELGSNVETIGEHAFTYTGLTSFSTYYPNAHSHLKTIKRCAFSYCLNLTNLNLVEEPNGLETIWDMAFSGCTGLTTITIPATVTSIGARAFLNCTNVTDVYCHPTAKYLSWDDFGGGFDFKDNKATILHVHPDQYAKYTQKFGSLNVTIQNDLPRGSFTNYSSGTCYATLANGTLTISPKNGVSGELAEATSTYNWLRPEYAYDVLHIVIEDGITNIPDLCLSPLPLVEDVQLGQDIQTIGSSNFSDYKRLASIELPEGITSLGKYVFQGCTALSSITLPASLRNLGFRAFDSCSGLDDVYCLVDADDIAFLNNSDVKDMKWANYLFVFCDAVNFHVYKDQLVAYQTIFSEADYVTHSEVTVVGDITRSWISNTCTVTLENGVLTAAPTNGVSGEMDSYYVSTGTPWYKYRNNVNSIVIANGVTIIKDFDFGYMQATSLTLGKDLTEIRGSAFENCTQLTSVVIPASVGNIGQDAFSGCSNLTSLSIMSEGSVIIREHAFSYCSDLNTITIKASTLNIKKGAFESCDEVSDIYLYATSANVTWAEDDDLYDSFKPDDEDRTLCHVYADQLEAYQTKFPNINVVFVGDLEDAPEENTWTSGTCTMTLEDGVLTVAPTNGVSGAMGDNSPINDIDIIMSVTGIVVTDGVTYIGEGAFESMESVNSISLGNDVAGIGTDAFNACGSDALTSLILPAALTSIGDNAFGGCTPNDVYCYAPAANLSWENSDHGFKTNKATRFHVNSDQYAAYQAKFPSANVTFVGDLGETAGVPTLSEEGDQSAINDFLADNDDAVLPELTIEREVFRNGYYNTICLPFAMSAAEIATSPLAGAEIKEFADAYVDGEDVLHLTLNVVTSMEAGVPYFIRYSSGGTVEDLDFTNVHIDKEPKYVEYNGVKFQGTFAGFDMPAQEENNHSYLFLGQNNQLFWPSVAGRIKPFRAYFIVATGAIHSPLRRGMPAVFDEEKVATSVELTQDGKIQSTKLIENGILYIIKNGVRYNAQGQVVK